ncbi:hypothetical protein [Aureimonas jatrophae]|nr:hypothetical protein [Aureimonas jatrophae]MBB3950482.1 hypothetical protein [Aureimonas jatrophae]
MCGAGTVFGPVEFPPEIRDYIDGMIAAAQSPTAMADLVEIHREADDKALAYSLEGMEAALSQSPYEVRVELLWSAAASFGAAAAMALCAQRCAQVGTYTNTEGRA